VTRFGEYPPPAGPAGEERQSVVIAFAPALAGTAAQDRIASDIDAMIALGIDRAAIEAAADRALSNGTSVQQELTVGGDIREGDYYRAVAENLSLPYIETIRDNAVADAFALDSQLRQPTMLRVTHSRLPPKTVIAPEVRHLPDLRRSIARHPQLKDSLAIASPATIRRAAWTAGAARRVRETVTNLFETQPRFSARIVFQGNQGFYAGVASSLLVLCLVAVPASRQLFHLILSFLYLAALLLRGLATFQKRRRRPFVAAIPEGSLPVYTVMVALYREADVAAQLVTALKRLHWPASLLDIKLVCEADDRETIEALAAQDLGPQFEIVEVPAMHPRTKPKALTYALAGARGAYLAVYDAEDRPHPEQLREAHARFAAASHRVACLQAPLVIGNGGQSWLSALFALEYAALFRALLPMLARYGMPLPLGGTSNHFRTEVLSAAGGWDPFNVTEDADLGMRLYRLGYRSEVIERQTIEDAPTNPGIWLRQRTRWYKGWLQTWLVMMRDPGALRREMGLRAFGVFHLLIGGMLISSLAHPLVLAFLLQSVVAMLSRPVAGVPLTEQLLFAIDFVNILGSYAIFLLLGTVAMIDREKKRIGWRFAAVPIYWMMVSLAAWRAVLELRSNPFLWHKTPHEPSQPGAPG